MNSKQEALNNKQNQDFSYSSNPLINSSKEIGIKKTSNKLYSSYSSAVCPINEDAIDVAGFVNNFCSCLKHKKSIDDVLSCLHMIFVGQLGFSFLGFGLIKDSSSALDMKLIDKINNTYSVKVLMSNEENPLIESINNNEHKVMNTVEFLKIHHIKNIPTMILPLSINDECIGILTVGCNNFTSQKTQLLKIVSEFLAIYVQNIKLKKMASQNINKDFLTGLRNHRCFHDELRESMIESEKNSQPLSVILFDINNVSKINRELGHVIGDEVIKLVAKKIEENVRPVDIVARYGGDEIAVILPNSDNSEAIYMAEYLNYIVSCCTVDDVGSIKMSIGTASYPSCSTTQEKLMLLVEQAMTISKHKSYKSGLSNIISAQDIDFWDGTALKSFASLISKRHMELGINFEDELVTQFRNEKIKSNTHLVDMVTSLAGAIDAKDPYTNGHSQSVSRYSEALASALNLPEKEVERIKLGALLHDVGKIGVPESILKKPDQLTDEEWSIMKQHPSIGVSKVLGSIEALQDLIPIVEHHHESWDGSGYPSQLKGEDIPMGARIVAIADAFHALISDRPYRKGLGVDKAIEILKAGAGIQWDRQFVRKFVLIAPSLSTTI